MIKTVLIIHGIQSKKGDHWQSWLKGELEKKDINVIMPQMKNTMKPDRSTWLEQIKELLLEIEDENLIIVGHSLGVVTGLDYIEQNKERILGFISVSGFSKDYHHPLNSYFLSEKEIDFKNINSKIKNKYVLNGDDDPYVPQEILLDLANNLKVIPNIYKKGGHLNTDTGFSFFPDILS